MVFKIAVSITDIVLFTVNQEHSESCCLIGQYNYFTTSHITGWLKINEWLPHTGCCFLVSVSTENYFFFKSNKHLILITVNVL